MTAEGILLNLLTLLSTDHFDLPKEVWSFDIQELLSTEWERTILCCLLTGERYRAPM